MTKIRTDLTQTKHDNLRDWISAFEKRTGLRLGPEHRVSGKHVYLDVFSPTGVEISCIAAEYSEILGWHFDSATHAFDSLLGVL